MAQRSLLMDVKVGQSLSIDGGRITLTVEEKSGQRVKLRMALDDGVAIARVGAQKSVTGAFHALKGINFAV